MTPELPPNYERLSDSTALPAYDGPPNPLETLPPTFKIGTRYTTPLISVAQVKSHLLLLGAFCRLRRRVFEEPSPIDPSMREDVKWVLFLTRAALRFELWVRCVVCKDARRRGEMPLLLQEYEIPPLDVLLCWHAYLLNPIVLFHDCEAMYPALRQIGPFPLASVAHRINLQTFEYVATINQLEEWEMATQQDFELPLAPGFCSRVIVACPRCLEPREVPLITDLTPKPSSSAESEGTTRLTGCGYAQNGFSSDCSYCGLQINHDTLAAANVARDLARASDDMAHGKKTFLNGNLLGAKGKVSPDIANHFAQLVLGDMSVPIALRSGNKRIIYGNYIEWNMAKAQKLFEYAVQARTGPTMWHAKFLSRSFQSYRQAQPFSIDIVDSVIRQFNFSEQLHHIDWTSSQYLATHPSLTADAISQYHMFLDLSSQTGRNLFPTSTIELAWRTHMLSGEKYHEDVLNYLDRFIVHDDGVDEGHFTRAVEETSKAWKARFHVSYGQVLVSSTLMDDTLISNGSSLPQLPITPDDTGPSWVTSPISTRAPATQPYPAFVRPLQGTSATEFAHLGAEGWDLWCSHSPIMLDGGPG
ncbi:hypothetical protein DL93DRAFT_2163647 [Clavulina sp. PMI_390]|nr:hypothetical protein DL93DRAFT_2163647 [Clavulina sp. PMI_390]